MRLLIGFCLAGMFALTACGQDSKTDTEQSNPAATSSTSTANTSNTSAALPSEIDSSAPASPGHPNAANKSKASIPNATNIVVEGTTYVGTSCTVNIRNKRYSVLPTKSNCATAKSVATSLNGQAALSEMVAVTASGNTWLCQVPSEHNQGAGSCTFGDSSLMFIPLP